MKDAKLCEYACRYDDMVDVIRELVMKLPKKERLTDEEKHFLSVAYKQEVNARRRSLKGIDKSMHKLGTFDAENMKALKDYKGYIKQELGALCNELISLIDSKLLPDVSEPADDIFYHKLKGDYYRYLAEVEDDTARANVLIDNAKENYQGASEYAAKSLSATDPLQIGLAMNYSVFMQEMLNNTSGARDLAKICYDNALDELESVREVDDSRYNECANMLKLMFENIKVWTDESTSVPTPKPGVRSRPDDF